MRGFLFCETEGHRVKRLPCPLTQPPSAPLEAFRVSFRCSHQDIFYAFANTDVFLPTKDHSMHIVLHCVVFFFFHLNHLWKPFPVVACTFGWLRGAPLCGLTELLKQPFADTRPPPKLPALPLLQTRP